MPGLEPFHVRQIRMVERVLGQKVSPRDHAMIDCLAERMERYGWHSVSINPVPLGYQYIIQAKSEKRRGGRGQAAGRAGRCAASAYRHFRRTARGTACRRCRSGRSIAGRLAAPTGAATPAQRVARGVDEGREGRQAGQVHHEELWPQPAKVGQAEAGTPQARTQGRWTPTPFSQGGGQEQAERIGRWPFWHQREHRARTAALSLPHLAACQIAAAVCACFRV